METVGERTKYLCGEIYVDVLTGPDCDSGREIRKISDVSFAMQVGGKGFSMSLKGFRDSSGKTLEQALTEHGEELQAIIEAQDALEEVQP
jgi:hypothetical protein